MQTRTGAAPAPSTDSIRSRCSTRVDHHDRRLLGVRRRAQRQLLERAAVGGRVGEQQVLEALLGQPERLRQGEGHQSRRSARSRRRIASSSARQRIDLLATRIGFSPARPSIVVGVRPHRVEVDEGERRLDLGEDRFVGARATAPGSACMRRA